MLVEVIWNALAVVAAALAPALISVAIARTLPPADVGAYGLLAWLVSVGAGLATLGIPTATTRYVAELHDDDAAMSRLVGRIFRVQIVAAVVVAILMTGVAFVGFGVPLLMYAALAVIPMSLVAISQAFFRGRQQFRALAIRQILSAGVALVFAVAALRLRPGLPALIAVTVLHAFVAGAIFLRGIPGASASPSPVLWGRFTGLARGLSALTLIDLVVWQRSEVFFLGLFRSTEEIAMYALPFSFVGLLMLVPVSLGGVLLPRVARRLGDSQHSAQIYAQGIRHLVVASLPIAVGAALFAEPILVRLLGDAYVEAVRPFQLLCLTSAVTVTASAGSALLVGEEAVGFMLRWGTAAAALNIGLAVTLIPQYGATGAAAANGMSQLFAVCASAIFLVRMRHMRIPWRSVLNAAGITASAGLVARITWTLTGSWGLASLLFAAVAGAAAFGLVGLVVGEWRWGPSRVGM